MFVLARICKSNYAACHNYEKSISLEIIAITPLKNYGELLHKLQFLNSAFHCIAWSHSCCLPATAPSSPHLAVERAGSTVFNITVSFAYTGGGDITQFTVEFRSKENPTAGWRSLGAGALVAEPTGNVLEWRVIAMHEYLSEQALEFRIAAVNMRGYVSEPSLQLEPYGESPCCCIWALHSWVDPLP